jgi:hypothetical protein
MLARKGKLDDLESPRGLRDHPSPHASRLLPETGLHKEDQNRTGCGVDAFVVVPLPTSPSMLSPQQSTLPPERTVHAPNPPPLTLVAFERLTCTGVDDQLAVEPLPSCPKPFPPRLYSEPLDRSAYPVLFPLTATAVAPLMLGTGIGVETTVFDEPLDELAAFSPQHCTVPSERSAQLVLAPAATAMAVLMFEAGVGKGALAVLPLPICPWDPNPQHCTVPPDISAHTC